MTTVFPPALFLLLVFALLSPSSLPWRTDAFVLVPLTKHHLPNSPLVSSSSSFLDPDRQDALRMAGLFGGITRTTYHRRRWAATPLSMTSDKQQQQKDNDVVVTTMEQYIDDEDWDGLETYWQSLGMENTAQEQDNPQVVSEWTTAILQQRLRALRKQHKAVQAEALLRTHLNSNDKDTIVNDICWLQVLRAHAALMGHAKKRRGQKGENDNNDDDNDTDDDVYDDDTRLQHVQALLKEMARGSRTHATWTLSIHAYNAVLQAMARHPNHHNKAILGQAENILFGLLDKYNNNKQQQPSTTDHQDMVIPNAGSFFYVYQASQRAPFPKVETLWHLQVSLWRQLHANGDTAAATAVVPSVRNLNAALAALARSHIPNKAHKAHTLVQQLHDIRQEAQAQQQTDQDTSSSSSSGVVLPSMQPNVGTYKNLMYAAAFTSHAHASPRERKLALEMAMDIHRRMIMGSASSSSSSSSVSLLEDDNDDDATLPPSRLPVRDQTLFYRLALQAVGHLVDNRTQRDERAVTLFQAACKAGVVDATIVTAFERAASETTVLRILGGFAEDLIQLPPSWTAQIRAAVEA